MMQPPKLWRHWAGIAVSAVWRLVEKPQEILQAPHAAAHHSQDHHHDLGRAGLGCAGGRWNLPGAALMDWL